MSLFDNVQRFQTLGITTETINNGKFQREIYETMRRFKSLDWGDVSQTDTESSTGNEYDRLTVLFPNEY